MVLTDRGEVTSNTEAVLLFRGDDGPAPANLWAPLADGPVTVPRPRQRVHRPAHGIRPGSPGASVWLHNAGSHRDDDPRKL